jgi:hypothetical protein
MQYESYFNFKIDDNIFVLAQKVKYQVKNLNYFLSASFKYMIVNIITEVIKK